MNYEQLTAQQALEIANLRATVTAHEEAMQEICLILCCIGGPLNDNKLCYTKEQLAPLHRINMLAEV